MAFWRPMKFSDLLFVWFKAPVRFMKSYLTTASVWPSFSILEYLQLSHFGFCPLQGFCKFPRTKSQFYCWLEAKERGLVCLIQRECIVLGFLVEKHCTKFKQKGSKNFNSWLIKSMVQNAPYHGDVSHICLFKISSLLILPADSVFIA